MVSGTLFDQIERVATEIREHVLYGGRSTGLAFGGLQIVATGVLCTFDKLKIGFFSIASCFFEEKKNS